MLSRPLVRVLAVSFVILLAAVIWFVLQVSPIGGQGREEYVTVSPGASLSAIAGEMHAEGVIGSPLAFRIDTVLFGAPTVHVGTYGIRQNSSFAEVKSILGGPPNVVAVAPLMTLHEVAVTGVASAKGDAFANSFVADAVAAAAQDAYHPGSSLEGLIGAGDYVLAPGETPMQLLGQMTSSFGRQAASVGLSPSTTLNGLNAYQLIIAASITQEEGYYPFNMPKVARVIFNRLAQGGPLQMDGTVCYTRGQLGCQVTPAMLLVAGPYNTYKINGLTPTPICTVSTSALKAVLHAPPGSWLYFVLVTKSGTMKFSSTLAGQLKAEKLAEKRGVG
jgi:UPF0755 protein